MLSYYEEITDNEELKQLLRKYKRQDIITKKAPFSLSNEDDSRYAYLYYQDYEIKNFKYHVIL